MRRLVRVLREDENRTLRSGELFTQLATLVADFSSGGEQEASLRFAAAARAAKLAPEVETSVQRVVQEALTNVRRHAPGATVAVRVEAVRAAARGDALVSPAVTLRLLRQLEDRRMPSEDDGARSHPLTDRELDVARLVAVGRTNEEIRTELCLSLSTVKTHLTNIHSKLGVRNRVEVAAWAWENGTVRPPR
ncbi:helix-turn-helix transcriptional regulator [Streptomyces sp. HC307]|uniref:helix-turn-helix transcriptional regulator n=1 Tax=Streptomyces flavusporus TaxID=3385496 RepID=UPI0039174DF6